MTKADYARHKGVSPQTVYDWIARGELVLVGGKIDAGATDQKATTQFVIPDAWADEDKKVNISPKAVMHSRDDDYSQEGYQPLAVDTEQAAAMVLTFDDAYPPAATYDELQARILDASDALGLEISTLPILHPSLRGAVLDAKRYSLPPVPQSALCLSERNPERLLVAPDVQ